MKKYKIFIVILLIIITALILFIAFDQKKDNSKKETKNEPEANEPYKHSKTIEDNYGDSDGVELKYDQYLTASGYAGAADNVYYTRNHCLYHLRLSTNETTKIAEGIKKIETDIDTIKAYKDSNFKIITEDGYIEYID